MNGIAAGIIESPKGIAENCALFTIDEIISPFVLHNITTVGSQYTFSLWVKSDADGDILTCGMNIPTTNEWSKHTVTFIANETDLDMYFGTAGTYYIYHPKLEIGNKGTDWTPAPEDVDSDIAAANENAVDAQNKANENSERIDETVASIQLLKDSISMLVTNENGESLMTQTESGWTFSTKSIQDQITSASTALSDLMDRVGSSEAAIDILSNSVEEFGVIAEYVHIGSYAYTDEEGNEQTEPSIDLFETDTGFKLKITNTRIIFTDGETEIVQINSKTKTLITPNAVIQNELQMGGFVWKVRANGNLGLMWKGVTS